MTKENRPNHKENHYNSVTNALRILKSFTEEEPERTVKYLSESLGITKSVTSRLLSTLAKEGFIHKITGTQKFRLGTSVLALRGVLISSLEIHEEAMPVLEQLVQLTGETAHLAVLENQHTVYLCKVNCDQFVQTMTHIGKRNPLHCTSSGKLLTAFTSKNVLEEAISNGLKSYTPYTITDPELFKSHLKQVRTYGYATDTEEHALGVASIAAPVRDYTKQVVAAVNIVGPIQRMHSESFPVLIKHVIHAAKTISAKMGYIGSSC